MTDARVANTQRYEAQAESIRPNPDLSDGAKRRMIREVYEEAAAEHTHLSNEAREARERAVEEAGYEVSRISVRSTFSEGPNLWDI